MRVVTLKLTTGSPELTPTLEQDYTVYAYDYSEYDTPLVGQGLLSRNLASVSPTPHAPASQSGTKVTGRVCKNLLAMLSNGVKETLEVKLKLVVVPLKHKTDYDKAMDNFRTNSRGTFDSVDYEMNNTSFNMSGDFSYMGMHSFGSQQNQPSMERTSMVGIDSLHDMLTPQFNNEYEQHHSHPNSIAGSSRPGTPANMMMHNNQLAGYDASRPSSRASNHPTPIELSMEEQNMDDGQSRKRARLTQTEWRGRPSFGKQTDSLRVVASTAASIREFRPSMLDNTSAGTDFGPRAPTPRPTGKRLRPTNMSHSQSHLRRNSALSDAQSTGPHSDASVYDDGIASSPDIPSSPPVFDMQDDYRSQAPSSPTLPEASLFNDSGFQSDVPTDMLNSDMPNFTSVEARQQYQLAKWRATKMKTNSQAQWNSYMPDEPVPHVAAIPTTSKEVSEFLSRSKARSAIGMPHTYMVQEPESSTMFNSAPASEPGTSSHVDNTDSRAQPKRKRSRPQAKRPVPALQRTQSQPQPQIIASTIQPQPALANAAAMPEPSRHAAPQAAVANQLETSTILPANKNVGVLQPSRIEEPRPLEHAITPVASALTPDFNTGANDAQTMTPRDDAMDLTGPVSISVVMPKQHPNSRKGQRPDKRADYSRANTWAGPSSDFDIAEAVDVVDVVSDMDADVSATEDNVPTKKQRTSSAGVRRATIRKQLQESVAAGTPPAFCHTCGAIETPTWRPYYIQDQEGNGEDVVLDDIIHAVVPTKFNQVGKVIEFQIYRKWSTLSDDEKKTYRKRPFCNRK
jgi:hypothetical protein